MGHLGKAKKCPPVPWRCEIKAGSNDYLYIVDAEGEVLGSLWGPVERTYPAARLLEALTKDLSADAVLQLSRPMSAPLSDEDKAARDERARLRGMRMRKQRLKGMHLFTDANHPDDP